MKIDDLSNKRRPPHEESQIREILYNGSDNVIKKLANHYQNFHPSETEEVFEQCFEIMADTIARVISFPFFCPFKDEEERRFAFLPGYIKKNGERQTYKIKRLDNTQITSDIAFIIQSQNEVRLLKGVSNQALLYHYLLQNHNDRKFSNGGTHQYLIANSKELLSDTDYIVDVIQVFSEPDIKHHLVELTFKKIFVLFNSFNNVEQLYSYFNSEFNKKGLRYLWPYNFNDLKSPPSEVVYKMRGYLVALWFKMLHDQNKSNINQWFQDCIDFAENSGFNELIDRIRFVQNEFQPNSDEQYKFWYSLRFTSIPDFSSQEANVTDTIGSAMILTNFQPDPSYFFYIKPWLNRIYTHLRYFETQLLIEQKHNQKEESVLKLFFDKSDYIPKKVYGERLISVKSEQSNKSYVGFKKPIGLYYWYTFESGNEVFKALGQDAIEKSKLVLFSLARCYWLTFIKNKTKNQNLESEINKELLQMGSYLSKGEFGKDCKDFDDLSIAIFCSKLLARIFALGGILCLNLSCASIHSFLSRNADPDFNSEETDTSSKHAYLCRNLFIHGLVEDDRPNSSKISGKENIFVALSKFEKELLIFWWTETVENLNTILAVASLSEIEMVKSLIRANSRPPELKANPI